MSKGLGITIEEARALVSDAALWPRVRDFLWNFAPQVHESWLEELEWRKALDESLGGSESCAELLMSTPRVRRFVLSSLGVEPCFHTFHKDDWSRLLLLDGAMLESIAKWIGALAASGALRRVTGGAAVRGLKESLPGVYPEVFGYTEYFRKLKVEVVELKPEETTAESIVEIGRSLLFSLVEHLPAQMLNRLRLKFPKAPSARESSGFKLPGFDFQPSNLQLLLKLRFPEAYSLCC